MGAHPDDIEALAGATVAGVCVVMHMRSIFSNTSSCVTSNTNCREPALRKQGTPVYFIIVTDGNKGCGAAFCQDYSTDQIASCAHRPFHTHASTMEFFTCFTCCKMRHMLHHAFYMPPGRSALCCSLTGRAPPPRAHAGVPRRRPSRCAVSRVLQ